MSGEVVEPLERTIWEEKWMAGMQGCGLCSLVSATCDICAANCHKMEGDPFPSSVPAVMDRDS